ncbi:MAG: tetratricopeptide repeat protein [Bacteroidales bacterium]|nr:tetratricopeptide repeat protein [Bacteroidales bacterium]
MKRLLSYLFLLVLCPTLSIAQDDAFKAANKAYTDGLYSQAAEQYEALLTSGTRSAAIYYNLGNARFRMGELGQAILNYERAHLLDPTDQEIQENIDFAYSKTEDHIEPLPQFFVVRWWNGLTGLLGANAWLIIAILSVLLFAVACAIFVLSRSYNTRKTFFIVSLAALLLAILCSALFASALSQRNGDNHAIVTAPMAEVMSSPDSGSVNKFILHEGTKVTITDNVEQWVKITIADGNKGWLQATDITTIIP